MDREHSDRDRRGHDGERHSRERDRDHDRDRDRGRDRDRRSRDGDRRRNDRDRSRSDRRDDDRRPSGKDEFGRDLDLMRRRGEKPERDLCIEIRNMSSTATYADVRRFFADKFISGTGLKLINDNQGNRTGIAYIRFNLKHDYEGALAMSGSKMKNEEVEILPISDELFDKAIDSYLPNNLLPREHLKQDDHMQQNFQIKDETLTPYVKCDDLPINAKEDDLKNLFKEYQFDVVMKDPKGDMSCRSAIMKLKRIDDVKRLFSSSVKYCIEGREVILSSCPEHLYKEERKNQNGRLETKTEDFICDDSGPRSLRDESPVMPINTDILLLKNLPPTVRDRDITDFFSDVGLIPVRIHILLDPYGNPVGEAFCEFNDGLDSAKGLCKDSTHMGKFIVNVKPVSRPEMNAVLGQSIGSNIPPMGPGGPRNPYDMMPTHMMGLNGPRHNALLGHSPQPFPAVPHLQDMPVDAFGKPGCVLACENIPFRAEIEDILEFFRGFNLNKENVIRRFNEKGLATGDARVAFSSPEEAQTALQQLKGKRLFGRQVWLTIL